MRLRPLLAAFLLLSTLAVSAVPVAHAQDGGSGLDEIEEALRDPSGGTPVDPLPGTPSTPVAPNGDDLPIPDAASGAAPVAPTETTPAPVAATATPTPPAYLVPGQSAGVQPVSGVAALTEPDLPLEPVRLAALIAVVLAALLVAFAALLRGLGVRTSVAAPVVVAPEGRFVRVRERTSLLADDVRDFLRHQR